MKYLTPFFVALWAILVPAHAAIGTVALLITSDLVLGVLAARKRKEPISSAGLRRTVTKFFVFETALILGFLAGENLMEGSTLLLNLVTGLVAITEIRSIFENLNELSGTDLLKKLISKLGSDNDPRKSQGK